MYSAGNMLHRNMYDGARACMHAGSSARDGGACAVARIARDDELEAVRGRAFRDIVSRNAQQDVEVHTHATYVVRILGVRNHQWLDHKAFGDHAHGVVAM